MIRKLMNKMMVGGVMLGAVGATFLAGAGTGVANADEFRGGRGNEANRVTVVNRDRDVRIERDVQVDRDRGGDRFRDNRGFEVTGVARDGCR